MIAIASIAPLVAAFAIKSSLIVACGALVAGLMRRASPASRHLVWTVTLAGVLVLPVVESAMPVWHVPVLPAPSASAVAPATTAATSAPAPHQETASSPGAAPTAASAPTSWPIATLLALVWIAGSITMCLRYAAGTFGIRRITQHSHRTEDARIVVRVQRLAERLRVSRPVIVRSATTDSIPVTWGIVYPAVLLPASAAAWDDDRLDAVLLHELAHVTRLDALTQLIAQLAMTIAWFNPFVWYAARRATVERERACDNLVLAHGQRASRYAEDLVALVQSLGAPRVSAFAALAMARRSELTGRVRAILDAGGNRRGASRGAATVATALCALTIGVGVAEPTQRTSDADLTALQGKWYVAGMAMAGQSMTNARSTGATITVNGTAFTTSSMGAVYSGTFKLGADGSTRTIDMLFTDGPEKGKTSLAVYKLEGETWTISIGMTGQRRPKEFTTHAGGGDVVELLTRTAVDSTTRPVALSEFAAPARADSAAEMAKLQGAWSAISITSDGVPLPDMYLSSAKRVAKGNEITVTVAGQVQVHVTFSVNPNTNPKSLEYVQLAGPDKGRTMHGIYELKGDTLRTCYAPVGAPRPAEFASNGKDGRTYSVWKRLATEPTPANPVGPVDASYRLGPQDVVAIIATGQVELSYALEITRDGFIVIPNVGRVSVGDLTLDRATQTIVEKLHASYATVGTASGSPTRVFVSVSRTRPKLPT
jgi:uncharacterized protein (TIGR03067 family)